LGIFSNLIETRATSQSYPAISNDQLWEAFFRSKGYKVSHSTAIKVAVVLRCADVVAKTMASLGCHLYKDVPGVGKTRATNDPLYRLLRYLPNPETTAYEFWHMYTFSLMLTKGAFAKIVRDQNGFVKELWNIPTNRVMLDRNRETGERYIDVFYQDRPQRPLFERLYEGNFMYTPGLRYQNEEDPEDFIQIAADVLGLTTDLNNYAKDYFENGSNMGGFVEYPSAIKDTAFKKFKEDWDKAYKGVMNQHKWAILEGGFKITKMDSNPEQAQALESRKFEVIEVCRIMGVTPHKVFSFEKNANYNSIEQLNIEYCQETIDPMDERISLTNYKDLLSPLQQKKHFTKFNTNKLLKGDTKTRTEYYNTMRQNGVFSTNQILDLEDMNLVPEEEGGNTRLVNGNMIPLNVAKNNLPKAMQVKGAGSNAGNN
jgi:HK97 family phage portal protein